jgi:hypothetical protein
MFEEGFVGVCWQATDYANRSTCVMESSPVLGEQALWEPEEPQFVTQDNVVWLFVSPMGQARYYRLRTTQ